MQYSVTTVTNNFMIWKDETKYFPVVTEFSFGSVFMLTPIASEQKKN